MPMPEYYYPQNYQPYQNQQMIQRTMPQMATPMPQTAPMQNNNNTGMIWVQGEAGAKAYPVAPNNSVLLMDSENSVMYIKSTDASGIPQPLRIFDYVERSHQQNNVSKAVPEANIDAVTREEFERLKEDVTRLSKGIRRPQVNNNSKNDKED